MKCPKCNHALPSDSEFCQYCGARIKKPVAPPIPEVMVAPPAVDAPASAAQPVVETSASEVPKQPLSVKEVDPTPVTETPNSPTPVLKKEEPVVAASAPKGAKSVQTRYCSKCGSEIDRKTKKCTGCGKQYFRGLRFTKFSVTVIILVLVIAVLSTLCVLQYIRNQETIARLETNISNLALQVRNRDSIISAKDTAIEAKKTTIKRLEDELDDLKEERWDNLAKLRFFDNYAEIIPDNGTRTYHKWGCSKLDTSDGFWIFNTAAAEDDYKKCPHCH